MRTELHAEWTKLRTLPGTLWLLGALAAATVALSWLAAATVTCPAAGCGKDAVKTSLTGVQFGQAFAVLLAVLVVSGEYGSGMIKTTLTAMPRRGRVLAAKAAVVTGPVLAAGLAAVLGGLLAGRLLLPGNGFTAAHGYRALSLTDGPVLRAATGSVLYLALVALLSMGVAAAVREAAAAAGIVLGLLYLFPVLSAAVSDPHWHKHVEQIGPMTAGLAVQVTVAVGSQPIGPWHGLGVLAAWAAGSLLLGGLLLRLRDA